MFFFIYSFSLNFSTDPLVLLLGVPGPSLEKPLKKYTRYGNTLSKTILPRNNIMKHFVQVQEYHGTGKW